MYMTQKKRIRAAKCLEFLEDHPISPDLFNCSGLPDCLHIALIPCCKNGLSKWAKYGVSVYRDDPLAEKYKDQFKKEYKDKQLESFDSIEIPYEEKYGEPWRFSHVEYWYETTFRVFDGDVNSETDYFDFKKWTSYAGPQGGANTFEDAIIEATKEVKKVFGSFKHDSFLTPEEIENNKKESMFFTEKCKDNDELYELHRNHKHIFVHDGHKNLRWLKWFMTTEYAKKNWEYYFKEWEAQIKKQNQ